MPKFISDVQLVGSSTDLSLQDSGQIKLGTGADLKIYHNSTISLIQNFTGNLEIRQAADDKDIIFYGDDMSGGITPYFRIDGSEGYTKIHREMRFVDDVELSLGSSRDLEIYHDGTNSVINNRTGDLQIYNNADDKDIVFLSDNGSGGTENYIQIDGSEGRTLFNKNIRVNDNVEIQVGGSADLKIYHNGTNSFIQNTTGDFSIENSSNDGNITFVSDNGSGGAATYIRIDGGTEETLFLRKIRLNDNVEAHFGTARDLKIYHNGTDSIIKNDTGDLYIENTADDKNIRFICDNGSGGTQLYFELQGVSGGTNPFTVFPDNSFLVFGNGHDLRIYHDGSNSFISDVGTGNLNLQGSIVAIESTSGENYFVGVENSYSAIYYDNSIKLQTTSTGISVTGDVLLSDTGTTGQIIKTTDNTEPYFALQRNSGSNGVGVLRLMDGGNLKFDTGATGAGQTTRLTIDGSNGNATFSGTISNSQFTIPNTAGTAGQVLKWPSSGTTLEWGSGGGGTIDGSGTANDIVMWSDSDTLTDAPIAISGNDATFAGDIDLTSGQLELRGDVALDHDGSSLYVKAPSNIYFYPSNGSSGTAFFSSGGALTIGSSGMTSGNPIITLYGRDTGNSTTDSLTTQVKTNGQAQFTTTGDRIRFDAAQYIQSQKTHIFDGEIFMSNDKYIRVLDSNANSWNRVFGVTNGDVVRIGAINSYEANLGEIGFFSNNTERMRLDASGKLGIGILSSIQAPVHIKSATEGMLWLDSSGNTASLHFRDNGAVRGLIGFSNGSSIYTGADDHDMVFRSEAKIHIVSNTDTHGISIDTNGKVGIGITDPSRKLEVAGDIRISGVGNGLYLDTTGVENSNGLKVINDYETVIYTNRGAAGFAVIGNQNIRLGFGGNHTNAQTDLLIEQSTGNVSIGLSANGAAKLHVHESTNLGGTAGNSLLLRRLSNTGGSGGNNVRVNEWAYRDAANNDWTSWRYHNAISIDSSYGTPNTDTRTFWERDPHGQQQYFGSGSSIALQINAGTDIRTPKIVDFSDSTYYIDLDNTGTSIRAAGTVHASVSNMSGYQLNGTYVMDSSRNLVNIADITATGDGQFAGAIRITETGTSQNILIGNQDSAGANKPAMIRGVNGHIRIGYGNNWTRGQEGGTFTSQMTFNANGVEVYGINDSNTNAFKVNRGSDNIEAFRVENSGEVVVSNNYFYAAGSGTSMYVQNTSVFRGAILNDASNADVRIADNLTVEGVITVDSLTDRNDSAYFLNPAGQSKLSRIDVVGDIRGTGQQLILNAGEAAAYATGQTAEHVYINAEGGLHVTSSPDNWTGGWSNRHVTTIGNSSGNSTFPNDIYIGDKIIHSGDTDTYLSFNAANQFRFVIGNSEKFIANSNTITIQNAALVLKGQKDNYDGEDRSGYWDYDDKVALALEPAANDGATAILFKSIGNSPSDFGYIVYDEDYGEAGVAAGENAVLLLSGQNDGGGSSDHVRVKGRFVVEGAGSSSNPTNAFQVKASNTTTDLFRVALNGDSYFNTNVTINSDLTVTGGDIVLGGTGRIQGIDTVSASTDAANKNYVDTKVAAGDLDVLLVDDYKLLDMPKNTSSERGAFNPIAVALRRAGRSLYNDPEFTYGTNNVGVYNNSGGTGVQHFRETDTTTLGADAPNSSGYVIRIVNNGNATSPGRGGFVQSIPSEDNHTFAQIFQAKLPVGYNVVDAQNAQGSNATIYWLTSQAGTGKWEWYVRVTHCGNSGTFSSGGHVYVSGGNAGDTFTWYLASCELIDVTEANQLSVEKLYAEREVKAPIFYDANDTTYYVDPTGDTNLIEHGINIHRGTGDSYGPQLIVGQTSRSLPYSLQDTNQRPILAATGQYPVLHLNHTVTSNTNHGPTIQFTHNGNAGRQWVFGSTGDGEHLDIGFSNTTQGNTSWNPHNGIAGYLGTTFMRFNENGNIGIGAAGDWGGTSSAGGDPAYAIDTKGALYNNTSITCEGVIQGDYFVGREYASEGYTIYKGYDNWNHMITVRGKTRPGQAKAQAAILGGHQTSFVEYAEANDTTGWYFIGSSQTTYEEIARITKGGGFTQTGNITASADIIANGHFYGRSVNGQYSNIYRMGGIYFTWDSDTYGTALNHSITSTYGGSYGDDLTINSYHHLRINLDSNSNNTDERFEIGNNTTGTGNVLFSVDGNAKMTLGRSGINPQFEMMFNDHASGVGWDTAIYMGRSNDLPEGTGFPAYVQAGGYGTMIKANSDGVFFGMEEYSSGNYRPIIQWGDDDSDTPFRVKHENGSEMEVSSTGVVSATTAFEAGRVKVTTGSIAASDAGTKGLVIHGNYTNGQYAHRFRKQDLGGNVVLFLDQSGSTANSFSQLMRFGAYTGNSHEFEVFGDIKATIDMHAGRYYDANSTGYYMEPGDGSKIKNIGINTNPNIGTGGAYVNIVNTTGILGIKIDPVSYSSAMQITTVPYAGGITLNYNRGTSGLTTGNVMSFQHNGASAGQINVTSSNTTSYGTSSDYRLKENVVELTGAITRVKQLQPKRFNFISDDDSLIFDGFLAHEAQTVVPESVIGEKDEVDHNNEPVYQNIDQSKLVPLLTAALKEAIQKIEDLEARVQTLEN